MKNRTITQRERIGWWIYYFFQAFRYTILRSGSGVVSHCKHSPSCGKYMVDTIQTKGLWTGLTKGGKRILTCR